jgi:hypothetical protein
MKGLKINMDYVNCVLLVVILVLVIVCCVKREGFQGKMGGEHGGKFYSNGGGPPIDGQKLKFGPSLNNLGPQ